MEIIPNEHGNRTTPSFVAFTADGERLVGDAARNQLTRNATNTVFNIMRLLGRNDPMILADEKHLPYKIIIDEYGFPKIQVNERGETKLFHPEEILSMLLKKVTTSAEAYLETGVIGAVLAVPSHFNFSQRQAVQCAAKMANLNVLRLMISPSCAAVALDNMDTQEHVRTVLIFDLGGGVCDVCIANIEDGIVQVLSYCEDSHLGGEDFTTQMVSYFVKEFEEEFGKDISNNTKAIYRLRIACEEAKKTLSSTAVARIDIENLYEGIDYNSKITRSTFEELNVSLFCNILVPVKKAMADARVTKEVIDEILLVGGSTRIPMIRQCLQDFIGGKKWSLAINPDEAVAHGSALYAAILSGYRWHELQKVLLLDEVCTPDKERMVVVSSSTDKPTYQSQMVSGMVCCLGTVSTPAQDVETSLHVPTYTVSTIPTSPTLAHPQQPEYIIFNYQEYPMKVHVTLDTQAVLNHANFMLSGVALHHLPVSVTRQLHPEPNRHLNSKPELRHFFTS